MDKEDVNPYIAPQENMGSAKQLKEEQKLSANLNNAYFPSRNESPYDLMKVNSQASNNVLDKVGEVLVANPGNPNYNPYGPPAGQPPMGYPPVYNQGYPMGQPYPNPAMGYHQPPAQQIFIQTSPGGSPICSHCRTNASAIYRSRAGCALWSWCFCLFCFTGFCCWIPCVVDDCYDQEIICASCQHVRGYIKSRFGC